MGQDTFWKDYKNNKQHANFLKGAHKRFFSVTTDLQAYKITSLGDRKKTLGPILGHPNEVHGSISHWQQFPILISFELR